MFKKALNIILWSSLLIPLVWLVQWIHPAADDYCYANLYANRGFFGANELYYMTWSGRFTATALMYFYLLDPTLTVYRIWALLMFLAILVGFLYFLKSFPGWSDRTVLQISGVLFLFVFFDRTIQFSETIYWATGVIHYMFSVPGVLYLWVNMRNGEHRAGSILVSAILAFLLSGLSEFTALLQLMIIGLCFLETLEAPTEERGQRLRFIVVLALSTIVGTAIAFLAPGNFLRARVFEHRYELLPALVGTWDVSVFLLRKWFRYSPLLPLSIFFLIFIRNKEGNPLFRGRVAWLLPLTMPTLLFISLFPSLYSTGLPPSGRTGNALFFIFLILWFGNLQALQRHLKRIPLFIYWIVFVALLLLTRWSDGNYAKGVIPDLAGRANLYHEEMLNRYEILNRSDDGDIVVPPIRTQPSFYQDDIITDPSDWRNQCAAEYFGKRSLRTAE